MVKIVIIGWYGTETIGDRAILTGIIRVLFSVFNEVEIKLGSILPFFTERTLTEDEEFIKSCSGQKKLPLSLFDSSKSKELDVAIRWADCVAVGGGPLEDIPSMFMLEYALKKAQKLHKRTMLLGCGIGPLYKKIYQNSMVRIVNHSDVAIFRDEISRREYIRLSGKKQDCVSAVDPAVFALSHYKSLHAADERKKRLVISVREFTSEYKMNKQVDIKEVNDRILRYIGQIQQSTDMDVLLLPMHYFGIGDDDRYFMNNFRFGQNNERIAVQNRVLSMEETMRVFAESAICVGMRFHSVVFQTLLNGRNVIWDYTDPGTGKIGAFVKQVKGENFYRNRYLNLQVNKDQKIELPETAFVVDKQLISKYENQFVSVINDIILN